MSSRKWHAEVAFKDGSSRTFDFSHSHRNDTRMDFYLDDSGNDGPIIVIPYENVTSIDIWPIKEDLIETTEPKEDTDGENAR